MSNTIVKTEDNLSDKEELFLACVDQGQGVNELAESLDCSTAYIYQLNKKLGDLILSRQRHKLTLATSKAVNTVVDTMDADASTEKGELKLKAAAEIMDRAGLTKHTSVEVSIESDNGLFILPGKSIVPPAPLEIDITPEDS